ncbi:TetR/AcrR family transcriptional regulator C-terminal domain-containing protein [Streptomyces sp. PTM05]|uniref:TetR/AcrR family transcriptional regulator C-terminal domain-containing protein n=1 Tax=Streptantibioticus parmotrematis TaxID=2873249 RepID=A0ABS7QWH1_9ACTN|nr:TetR/AcrR family transcriptional regulator C-terminal domain-containing protein [Streptantibioticus parmotrematis]MBY8887547.1 TetR/AcrR family transcriptional regulator C-terminal domain-containing protein [Streptantibioticus parmotrematis]
MPSDAQVIPSVWTRPRRVREQPALSREQIVAQAVQLLDAEGIDALSMRKLGNRLGAGATSLYRHVANKDELIELAVDETYGEVEFPPPAEDAQWREAVVACAQSLRATILRHPWIASVLGEMGMSYLGPNWMQLSDALLAPFERAGLPTEEADHAVATVIAYVTGMATSEAAWLTVLARSGQDEQEWVERLWPAAEEAAQSYPRLRDSYAQQRGKSPRAAREEGFAYGLDRILDGLATRLGATTA